MKKSSLKALSLFLGIVGSALILLSLIGLTETWRSPSWQWNFQGPGVFQALGSLAEVMAAILGITLTVVAIVVQLASARYPAKIVDLFMTDPLNIGLFAFMTGSCTYVVVAPTLGSPEPSRLVAMSAVVLTLINFGLLLPYFGHVFSFLEPNNIITKIQARAYGHALAARRGKKGTIAEHQAQLADALERIADNSMAAMGQSDRALAIHTVQALQDFLASYIASKGDYPAAWHQMEPGGMSGLSHEFLDEIRQTHSWVEAKTLMELDRIFRKSLELMPELVSQVALSTRLIGQCAVAREQGAVRDLVIQFFNTYMRHTINAANVRAAYNVLYEYRHFAEHLQQHDPACCLRIVEHLVYYGRTANTRGMPFVTVTVAHDVRALCECAYETQSMDMLNMLRIFLTLDQPSETDGQETALLGVRRAQSILGAFFLERGDIGLAEQIRFDMRDEPLDRLERLRDEILSVKDRKFWEITDRGFNFDWVSPQLRPYVGEFFSTLVRRGAKGGEGAA